MRGDITPHILHLSTGCVSDQLHTPANLHPVKIAVLTTEDKDG